MTDAWQRRKEKDYPKMPKAMKFLFRYSINIKIILRAFSLILCSMPTLYILINKDSTWMAGGKGLLSDIPYIIEVLQLGILGAVLFFILPLIFSVLLNSWYYKARVNFPESN